ncbi:MAG: hypothetical protein UH080_09465 [Ruminococcus sp.]|nr:hypothetical protein [Ruminococcus sp.]
MSDTKDNKLKLNPKKVKLFGIVLSGIGFLNAILIFYSTVTQQQNYNMLLDGGKYVYGKVDTVRQSSSYGDNKDTTYYGYGQYIVDDKIYEFSISSHRPINQGGSGKIYYEENNPSNYVVEGVENDFTGGYVGGVFVLAFSVAAWNLDRFIFQKKKEDESAHYNRRAETAKRSEYVDKTGDVWNIDLTNERKNEKLYRSRQTSADFNMDSSKGNLGSTAFYKRNKFHKD